MSRPVDALAGFPARASARRRALWATAALTNKVVVFDQNLAPVPSLTITDGLNQPISLAIGKTGVIYLGSIGTTPHITTLR